MDQLEEGILNNARNYLEKSTRYEQIRVRHNKLVSEAERLRAEAIQLETNASKMLTGGIVIQGEMDESKARHNKFSAEGIKKVVDSANALETYQARHLRLEELSAAELVAQDQQTIILYEQAQQINPTLAERIEDIYQQSQAREDERTQLAQPLTAEVLVRDGSEGELELYLSVPHEMQDQEPFSYLVASVMDSVVGQDLDVRGNEYKGIVRLDVPCTDSDGLVAVLKKNVPEELTGLNIGYRVSYVKSWDNLLDEARGEIVGAAETVALAGTAGSLPEVNSRKEDGRKEDGSKIETTCDEVLAEMPAGYLSRQEAAARAGLMPQSLQPYLDVNGGLLKSVRVRNPKGFPIRAIEEETLEAFITERARAGKNLGKRGKAKEQAQEGEEEIQQSTLPSHAEPTSELAIKTPAATPANSVSEDYSLESRDAAKIAGISSTHIYKFLLGGASARDDACIKWEKRGKHTFVEKETFYAWRDSRAEARLAAVQEKWARVQPQYVEKSVSRAVTGRPTTTLKSEYSSQRGGPIETIEEAGKVSYKLSSLVSFLTARFKQETIMHNLESAADYLQRDVQESFAEVLLREECLETISQQAERWELATITGSDEQNYFSQRELDRVLTNHIANWRLEKIKDEESITRDELSDLLSTSRDSVKQMISRGKFERTESSEVTIDSVKNFLDIYQFNGDSWSKKVRASPRRREERERLVI